MYMPIINQWEEGLFIINMSTIDKSIACITIKNRLQYFNSSLWIKIDNTLSIQYY